MGYGADAAVPTTGPASMLELEQWNSALSSITGTLVRGTGRISTAHCLDLLEVGPDPSTRQKVGKRLVPVTARAQQPTGIRRIGVLGQWRAEVVRKFNGR